ncbi:MAG: AAA family ATPase [Pseudomonadota bacterium]
MCSIESFNSDQHPAIKEPVGAEAVIFVGIQATGKSSFYYQRFFRTHVRLNLDMLRTRRREEMLLSTCLAGSISFVVDNTNPTVADRAKYIRPARRAGFRVTGYYFESKIGAAMERNALRSPEERIPELGIRGIAARLVLPRKGEGFDDLYYVRIGQAGSFQVEDWRDEV